MWMALMMVTPAVSVGSVHATAVSPFRVRAVLIAVRSSVMCAAFTTVVPAASGLSVKAPELVAKVAVTVRAALIVTLQVPVPVQLPLQPEKVELVPGTPVRVTMVLLVNDDAHAVPHEIPVGALVTVPLPVPALVTVSTKDGTANVALTLWAALIVTVQVLVVPVQPPPLQPVNSEPAAGAAVNVTMVPLVNEAAHAVPQEMPAGALVTVPVPVPDFVMVSAKDGKVNVAVTEAAAFIVTVQVPVPVQPPPLQPENVEPAAGTAVKVTAVPPANGAEQVVPHEIPAGALVTVPDPVPALLSVSVKGCSVKVAVTDCAALMVVVQVPVPVHPPPLQPENVEPAAGVAVKVTAVPLANGAEQVVPQEMPVGMLVTVPEPAPALLTVSEKLCSVNVAVTEAAAFMVTVQVPVPVQPPLQPENVEPAAGVAVRVTAVPVVKDVEHVVPQEIPVGALVTVPVPVPALVTVSAKDDCTKLAVTEVAAFTVTVQELVPVQPPPLQPENVEPAAGVAVNVTAVPLANGAEQVVPQETPVGALVTVPDPVPALLTVSVNVCSAKVAVTVCAALIVTVQVLPVPVQTPPLQPVNVEPAAGVAVRVTAVPLVNGAEHEVPQEMPVGTLVTVPDPAPA